jgi:hypothetical protein
VTISASLYILVGSKMVAFVKKAEPWAGSGIVLSGLVVVGGAKMERSLHRVYRARFRSLSPPPPPKEPSVQCAIYYFEVSEKRRAGLGGWHGSSDEKHVKTAAGRPRLRYARSLACLSAARGPRVSIRSSTLLAYTCRWRWLHLP